MLTIKHPIQLPFTYPLERIGALRELLFFDIETTGFSGAGSQLYLIGCAYHDGFGWKMVQWFAEDRRDEAGLLTAFFTFLRRFKILVHFNGDGFDLPYLLACCRRLGLPYNFDGLVSFDIYKKIKPYRRLLGLESLRQKAIERFLGVSREDKFGGGELIEVYHAYTHSRDKRLYDLLILHNEDDLKGMPVILPILSYADLFQSPFTLCECRLAEFPDGGSPLLQLGWRGACPVPVPLEYEREPVSLELSGDTLRGRVRLYRGELKFFYPDYQDYYYLPLEDTAIHKSVGAYVDKAARRKATARTCYTRRSGLFLPQFAPLWQPLLRESYKAAVGYTPYDPGLFDDSEKAAAYAGQLLEYLQERS